MTTEKQIIANRLNGLKGGVKTPEGKLAVRFNAVSHGLFSKDILLPGEDPELLDQLRQSLIEDVKPEGEFENMMVEFIVASTWRLKRVLRSEQTYGHPTAEDYNNVEQYYRGLDYRTSGWQKYMRYTTTLERQIYKAMNTLERLQRLRRGEQLPAPLSLDVNVTQEITGSSDSL